MQTFIEKEQLLVYLKKKYRQSETDFNINMTFLKGENFDNIQSVSELIEVSKKMSEYKEKFGYSLGQLELILDLIKQFSDEQC